MIDQSSIKLSDFITTEPDIAEISSRTLGSYFETDSSSIKLSNFITTEPDIALMSTYEETDLYNRTFVDIDYIINLVYDLDYEGLLYLRNVVEDLIKKWIKLNIYIVNIYHHEWISYGCL